MNNNQGREGNLSLPSRERGLKLRAVCPRGPGRCVAPFTGAWIEIEIRFGEMHRFRCRSLHGSVD